MPQVEPLVSVVTPSFNQAEFLSATLDSVAAQDYPAVEHIVMDGGSTDGSVELLESFAASHALSWISAQDAGQADAIKQGFELARGEILTWLNSDDVYLRPDAISAVVDVFRQGASLVTGAGQYLNQAGQVVGDIPVRNRDLDPQAIQRVDSLLQPATFFRRSVYEAVGIDTTLTFAFDWDLFVQMSRVAPFTQIDLPIAGYRLHPAGKTVSAGIDRQRELLLVAQRYGRATPVIWLMKGQIALRRAIPQLGDALDRAAWWSNRLTRDHGIPC